MGTQIDWRRARKLDKSEPGYKEQRLDRAADNWLTSASLDKRALPDGLSVDEIATLRRLRNGPVNRDGDDPIPYSVATSLLSRRMIVSGTAYTKGLAANRRRVYEITKAGRAALSRAK